MNDALDSRDFYELCQQYRHEAIDAAQQFEALKQWIRVNATVLAKPVNPIYED